MNKTQRNVCAILFACALSCGVATYAAAAGGRYAAAQSAADAPAQAALVAGTYHRKTYRPGKEGYDNTLEVEDKGDGRLRVSLSGTYIYKVDGAESMHEASGEGEATLRGNIATASVTADGADSPCRVLIIFDGGEAGVKAGGDCNFNVDLDGAYLNEKGGARRVAVKGAAAADAAGPRQVRYDRLEEFVNDFNKNRTGLRYVITSVPAEKINKITRANQRGLFYLATDENDTGASSGFVTTAALVKSLRANGEYEPASLRVTATLVEFRGEFDVYRMSFVTKVEGLGDGGSVLWSAAGTEPVSVRIRQ